MPPAQKTNPKGLETGNHKPCGKFGGVGNPLAPKGLKPEPFQVEALAWAVERLRKNKPSYLALDPGLGKTIIAAMLSNQFPGELIVYVCPPFLKTNTEAEFQKWCFNPQLFLIADSMIWKPSTRELFKALGKGILIVDEAHRFKNITAKRTKVLLKELLPRFEGRVVFMSGTPLPNQRPIELWPILSHAIPKLFDMKMIAFGLRYCKARYQAPYGWDFSGRSNFDEFRARVQKSFMLRIRKDVLKLPPKRETLLTVGPGIPPIISKLEKKILAHYSPKDLLRGKIASSLDAEDLHIATYRRLLGEYKLKYILPYIESLLTEAQESLLIFAIHKNTIAKLEKALEAFNPIVITGDVPASKRNELVKRFQNGESKVFLGNIQASGVGFTLTKATRALFVEYSFVDGENSQAADRMHRIGQKQSVLVQYVVLKDSFDRKLMETLLNKRKALL